MNISNSFNGLLQKMGTRSSFIRLIVVTVLIFVAFSIINPQVFLSPYNFQFISLASPELAILSLAVAVSMLTAGIDLSTVSISNMTAIVAALVMIKGNGTPSSIVLGCLAGLGVALLCGLLNGVLIGVLGVQPILVTLGTSQLFAGLGLILTGGTVLKGLPNSFTDIALLTFAGIPIIFWIMLLLALATWVLIAKTAIGFEMRMIGTNPLASTYSGASNVRILLSTYLTSALLSGFAGLIISARSSGADSKYGVSYVLLAIVIAVLAGVDPEGGYITVPGVIIAVLAYQMLATGLLSIQDNSRIVDIAQGFLLITMVLLNTWGDRFQETIKQRIGLTNNVRG